MKSRETLTLAGKNINVDVFEPSGGSPTSAVVVAYGTEGMNPPFNTIIDDFCSDMEKQGYLTVLPYYFESTGTAAGLAGVASDLLTQSATWIDTLAETLDWAKNRVNGGKVAFVGFSLGANQVLNAALKANAAAVVDYFGPVDRFGFIAMPSPSRLTEQRVRGLPPTLIHHGNRDFIVPATQSALLKGWLDNHGNPCIFHDDYKCGHPGQPEGEWDATANDTSTRRTISFLGGHL